MGDAAAFANTLVASWPRAAERGRRPNPFIVGEIPPLEARKERGRVLAGGSAIKA